MPSLIREGSRAFLRRFESVPAFGFPLSYLATVLLSLLLSIPAMSVELFRYRYQDQEGAEYEAVFETDEQSVGKTVDKEKAEEIDGQILRRTGWNDRKPGTKD